MKISEMIRVLKEIELDHGDVEILLSDSERGDFYTATIANKIQECKFYSKKYRKYVEIGFDERVKWDKEW